MSSRAKTHCTSKLFFTNNEGKGYYMNIKEIDQTFKQIIKIQEERQLSGDEFLQLIELQTLLKVLEENNKEYRKVVDSLMA